MKTKLIVMAAAAVMALNGCGGGGSDASAAVDPNYTPHPYDAPLLDENTKAAYLNAINAARAVGRDCGDYGHFDPAPPLQWDDRLYLAAKEHSDDMAVNNWFEHVGTGTATDWTAQVQDLGRGSIVDDRMHNNGYWGGGGENIAYLGAGGGLDVAIRGWLNSPPHCGAIMDPEIKRFGMAVTGQYWTQVFGGRD